MDRLHRTRRPRPDSLLLVAVWIALTSSSLLAQDIPPAPVGDPPANSADAPQQLPQELEAELLQWANATKDIPKLEGEHTRWIYDHVFQVEKRAIGSFYYEAPDKGRIDLEPDPKVHPGAVNSNKIGKNGKPFTIQPDQAEKWICDGQTIMQINDDEKTYESIQIPPQNQGHNIMDGPLPFLFGMPPEQAKKRFWLKLARPLNRPRSEERRVGKQRRSQGSANH